MPRNLRQLRKLAGATQLDLVLLSGVSRTTVQRVEYGARIEPENERALADVLRRLLAVREWRLRAVESADSTRGG